MCLVAVQVFFFKGVLQRDHARNILPRYTASSSCNESDSTREHADANDSERS